MVTQTDRDALELAIKLALANPAYSAQIQLRLRDDGRTEAGKFAAYCLQSDALQLKPWQITPMYVDDPDELLANQPGCHMEHEAARLLKQMLALGVSRFPSRSGCGNQGRTKPGEIKLPTVADVPLHFKAVG
jgi:hypothetical protein